MGLVETFSFSHSFSWRAVDFRVVPGGSGLGRCGPQWVCRCLFLYSMRVRCGILGGDY